MKQINHEVGAASMKIELKDGVISIYHGADGTLLAHKTATQKGDWDNIVSGLKAIGIKWVVTA